MRALIIGTILFLSACNGSTTTNVPYSDPALVAKVDSLTKALAAATHESAQKFSKLQLVGQAHGIASAERTMAIGQAAVVSPNFGPCTDMGVLIGRSGGSNAMTGNIQSFQTCVGYEYSVDSNTGDIAPLQSMEWDGPNCTGNVYATFTDLPLQTIASGAVFTVQTTGAVMMVVPGTQVVHPVIVSAEGGGACQNLSSTGTDIVYPVQANDTSVTGVPNSEIPVPYTIGAP